jgi:hypothetical protein
VGDHVTRYVRRGSGSPVVMIGANRDLSAVWVPLVEALGGAYRLVVPQPPPPDAGVDVAAWLREFIEGVGLSSVALIAGGAARAPALELATVDDFMIRRLVLVPGMGDDPADAPTEPSDPPDAARALWVLPEWSPADAVERIQEFIAERRAG